jgi:FdhD protein
MERETIKVPVMRFSGSEAVELADMVVRELSLTIVLNGTNLVTILCSPIAIEALTVGFLIAQGFIEHIRDINKIWMDKQSTSIHVETTRPIDITFKPVLASSGARNLATAEVWKKRSGGQVTVTPPQIYALMEEFEHTSRVFERTGGVHSAALCDTSSILVFHEDIGRHNAIDKIFGQCMLQGILLDQNIIITSGRVSSEIVYKVAKGEITILVSRSAPTDRGVALADGLGITLIGFVRDNKMNVYTNRWRVMPDRR